MAWLKFGSSKTFGDILEENRGVGPGFDLLRLGLALAIMASHCSSMTGNRGFLSHQIMDLFHLIWPSAAGAATLAAPDVVAVAPHEVARTVSGPARPYTLSHVPMFFALSGFLVAGSASRTRNVIRFLGLRVIRILPALLVEVFLSAILLGGVFTTLPLNEYYTSSGFYSYFLNILGNIHYTLPGVFTEHNPSSTVNANLWTLAAEFHSYAITAVLMLLGIVFNRILYTVIFVIASLALAFLSIFYGYGDTQLGLDGNVMIYYFFSGLLFYIWKDKIPYSLKLFVTIFISSYVLMLFTHTAYIYPTLLTYVTIFIGLSALPQFAILKTGDYSYGIYLYGYPVSQALIASVPVLRGNLPGLLISAVLLTSLVAFLSWHLVEKHFIVFKKYLSPRSAAITQNLHPHLAPLAEGQTLKHRPVHGQG